MTDYFALLKEPRRPWIDPDLLKQKFLDFSARFHPDRVHQSSEVEKRASEQRYAELNAAYCCLRDPKERLRHLLKLLGAEVEAVQQIPPDLMEVYMEVSRLCREADGFLAEKAKAASPLLQVQMFERGQVLIEQLRDFQQTLASKCDKLLSELREIDAAWDSSGDGQSPGQRALTGQLENLCRLLSYFDRWMAQLQERMVQLSF
jgi:DnaJ-domain-containing protein 1